jgi:hypothetical protein
LFDWYLDICHLSGEYQLTVRVFIHYDTKVDVLNIVVQHVTTGPEGDLCALLPVVRSESESTRVSHTGVFVNNNLWYSLLGVSTPASRE